MTIAALLRAAAHYLEPAITAPSTSTRIVGVVTYGEVAGALTAFSGTGWADLQAAWALRFSDLPADETVAEDALAAVAPYWPPAGTVEVILKLLPVVLTVMQGNAANMEGLNPAVNNTADNHWPLSRGR